MLEITFDTTMSSIYFLDITMSRFTEFLLYNLNIFWIRWAGKMLDSKGVLFCGAQLFDHIIIISNFFQISAHGNYKLLLSCFLKNTNVLLYLRKKEVIWNFWGFIRHFHVSLIHLLPNVRRHRSSFNKSSSISTKDSELMISDLVRVLCKFLFV